MFNAEQLASIRNDFPGLKSEIDGRPILYLDSAATSLKPQAMIDATVEYYGGVSSNVHRGKSYAIELVSNIPSGDILYWTEWFRAIDSLQ